MARWIVATACFLTPGLAAQDGPTARVFCDPADPGNGCPGTDCKCSEDVLAIRFERSSGPILEVNDELGLSIEAAVVLETKSPSIAGWSYGVRHDGSALTIESATTDGTDASRLFRGEFNATRFKDVSECSEKVDRFCFDPVPATGFISAVVLSLTESVTLPTGSNSLARARYRLEPPAVEAGEAGILLELTGRLAPSGRDLPVQINLGNSGLSVRPRTLVHGRIIVKRKAFHRGDPDGDGRLSVADAIALLLFLFLSGPSPDCLEAGDADDDGRIDTTDPVVILRWLFTGGSTPAPPGPPPAPCGLDPGSPGTTLGCDAYAGC